jgi:fructose transport system substrate-binding protein
MIRKLLATGSVLAAMAATPAMAADLSACLITKTDTNPFFVKMKEGATAKAEELGIELKSFAGKVDGDHETQVAAIETCIADGAKGILLTASDTSSIVPAVKQARDNGLLVIALDTPLSPIDAADATFATDNFLAGELIGKWAAGSLGDEAANAKIAMLDLGISQPTVGVLRDQGFLQGFGIDLGDPNKWGDETDPRIVGNDVTAGQRGRWPPRHGEPACQGPNDQRCLHDQRASCSRRL